MARSNKFAKRRKTLKRMGYSPFVCFYCLEIFVELTLDHLLPVSAGGTDVSTNLRFSCYECNQEKADWVLDTETIKYLEDRYWDYLNSLNNPFDTNSRILYASG